MVQQLLVLLLIALSSGYACWRIYQAFHRANDPCAGCAGCALKGKIKEKSQCREKK